jgi:hypothetical protein
MSKPCNLICNLPEVTMTPRLTAALQNMASIENDCTLSPAGLADARDAAIYEGLRALADAYGKTLMPMKRRENGEIEFNLAPQDGSQSYDGLAEWLSLIPTRGGVMPSLHRVVPESNWCWIKFHDAKRLLWGLHEAVIQQQAPGTETSPAP